MIRETGGVSDNGHQEIYVNTKIDDGSDIAELMRIYKEREAYDYKKFPRTSRRKEQFIKSEKGANEMCEIVENYAREVAAEAVKKAVKETVKETEKRAAKETAKNLFENGVDFQVVCRSVGNISVEELKVIYKEVQQKKSN